MALHSWHRYFCQFRKKDIASQKVKQVKFTPIGHQGQVHVHMTVLNNVMCMHMYYVCVWNVDSISRFYGCEELYPLQE